MKVMVAGEWRRNIYQEALAAGFATLGCTVIPFKTLDYAASEIQNRIERKLMFGPKMNALNRNLRDAVQRDRPEALFLYRCVDIYPETLRELKKSIPELVIASYNNDNPFDDGRAFIQWRLYFRYIRNCDINYMFRIGNVEQAQAHGVPNPQLLLPYFVQGFHRPLCPEPMMSPSEVVFVGHYEPDGRREYVEHLLANGVPLKIYGNRWDEVPRSSLIRRQKIDMIWGEESVRIIAGAKMALVFLSGRNHDQYTTRCFEIPACGSLMLAPRTAELQSLFQEGKEAIFYSSPDELLNHVRNFAENESARKAIAERGYRRCLHSQHSNIARARQVLRDISVLRAAQ